MSSIKQIEANRLNAKKSTGPRTTEGKSATRLNALKHSLFATDPIIPGEDPAHFEALRTSYYDRFQPATPEELVLVATMVRDAWGLERCSNSETAIDSAQRNYRRNLELLIKLQAARQKAVPAPGPIPQLTEPTSALAGLATE